MKVANMVHRPVPSTRPDTHPPHSARDDDERSERKSDFETLPFDRIYFGSVDFPLVLEDWGSGQESQKGSVGEKGRCVVAICAVRWYLLRLLLYIYILILFSPCETPIPLYFFELVSVWNEYTTPSYFLA